MSSQISAVALFFMVPLTIASKSMHIVDFRPFVKINAISISENLFPTHKQQLVSLSYIVQIFYDSLYFDLGKERRRNAFFKSLQVPMVPLRSVLSQSSAHPLREYTNKHSLFSNYETPDRLMVLHAFKKMCQMSITAFVSVLDNWFSLRAVRTSFFYVKENWVFRLEPLGNFINVVESSIITQCYVFHVSHLFVG